MTDVIIHTDGGARGNPGPSGIGVIAYDNNGAPLFTLSKFLGTQTNNWAEYEGLIQGLTTLQGKLGTGALQADVEVRMDSELIVKQMKGEYRVKDAALKAQNARVLALLPAFKSVQFMHVRREDNKEADSLANEAMDRGT